MIDLQTAQALKAAGLNCRPQIGDWYFSPFEIINAIDFELYKRIITDDFIDEWKKESTWLPLLDQLLVEIEKHNRIWRIESESQGYAKGRYSISTYKDGIGWQDFWGDSPDEAAAQALLWILQKNE